jgi:hypothetical protein|tara:strand:+ start:1920 stop:2516 length:597 start_codon:yes stop_codon:yes gene_type:complete
MKRYNIINHFIKKNNYTSYLEIGYGSGHNYTHIDIPNKIGVDPNPNENAPITSTSDDFFSKNIEYFDIIFIDGMHRRKYVENDINNSLNFLKENGTIVMHDCNPPTFEYQTEEHTPSVPGWCGDTWKAFVDFRSREDLFMYTVDTDWGCGVIKRGKQNPILIEEEDLNYENLNSNRKEWLNLITVEEFISKDIEGVLK